MKYWFFVFALCARLAEATTCYTDCTARFPKWYQEPDRKRCQAEKAVACLDPSPLPGTQDLSRFDGKAREYAARLKRDFLQGGYVVSRKHDGAPEHEGDSLIWTGIALASLECSDGDEIQRALVNAVERNDGRLVRIEPLPASYKGNETSRDQVTGAIFGMTVRSQRCAGAKAELERTWEKHRNFVNSHGGRLHEGSNSNFYINPAFQFIWDLVSHKLGNGDRPSDAGLRLFESGMIISVKSVKWNESACYPIHLSTLLAITSARLGRPINELTKREFCSTTRGMDLPLTDWFCGRGDAAKFLAEYEPNKWEYRHQRCAAWESPDVSNGETTPGVDFLILHRLAGGH